VEISVENIQQIFIHNVENIWTGFDGEFRKDGKWKGEKVKEWIGEKVKSWKGEKVKKIWFISTQIYFLSLKATKVIAQG